MPVPQLSKLTLPLSIWIGIVSPLSSAQDDFFNTISVDTEQSTDSERGYSLIGWLEQKLGYGLESPPPLFSRQQSTVNQLETSLFTQLDMSLGSRSQFRFSGEAYHDEIYRYRDNIDFSEAEINEFRNRFEVRDFYLEQEFDNGVYLKFGNQLLAWGVTEYLRITDLVNTENQFTIGQQDLEDLRRQVPAMLTSFNLGDWTLDTVLTYGAGRDDIAPAGDEFDQFAALRTDGTAITITDPVREEEFFLRASTTLSSGDLQIVAGEFNDNSLSLEQFTSTAGSPLAKFTQNRMRALGIAGTWVDGPWLFFGELGMHANKSLRPLNADSLLPAAGWDKKDHLLAALGIEYNGFRNLLLTMEIDGQRIQDNEEQLYGQAEKTSLGMRAYWTALNERLQVLAVVNELADDAGRISRLSVDYDWSDDFTLGLLWVNYDAPVGSYVNEFSRNDVLQLQLRYNFQY